MSVVTGTQLPSLEPWEDPTVQTLLNAFHSTLTMTVVHMVKPVSETPQKPRMLTP